MAKFDHRRPRYRTEGRATEAITGDYVPPELQAKPRAPSVPKATLREQADRAVAEFNRRQSAKPAPVRRPTDEEVPW